MPTGDSRGIALSLVIPVYNESESLDAVLATIERSLNNVRHEVILVDDNSPDGTGRIADALARQMPHIRVIHRASKQGVASAILDGARVARGAVIATMNADQSEAAALIPSMLELAASHDIVIGSRYITRGMYTRGRWRGLVSAGARIVARTMLPEVRGVEDSTSGFFMFRRAAIDGFEIPRTGRFARVSIGVKFLLGLLVRGHYSSVCEVPFHDDVRTEGRSKFSKRDYFAYLSYVLYLAGLPHEARAMARFLLVGCGGFALYSGLLYLLTDQVGIHYLLSAPVSWVAVVSVSFVVHDRWTFADRRSSSSAGVRQRGLRFLGARLLGLGLNVVVLALLTEVAGLHYMASAVVAVAVVVAWNYAVAVRLVWGRNKR